jgi:DNA-binding response OmpR family regulator
VRVAKRVLVAVADDGARSTLRQILTDDGYLVGEAATGAEGLAAARRLPPDAMILDEGLADLSGAELCGTLRQETVAPILVLVDGDDPAASLRCLRAGADVCVARPFSLREVQARVLALIRRVELSNGRNGGGVEVEHLGDFRLDRAARTVHVAEAEIELTLKEFDLLSFLLAHSGRVQSRERILEQVWGNALGDRRTVNVHVRWLREKLSQFDGVPFTITTVTRAGYRLDRRLEAREPRAAEPRTLRGAAVRATTGPRL